MPGRVLVVQHVPHSSLGVYGDVLAERGDEEVRVSLHEGDPLPTGPDCFGGSRRSSGSTHHSAASQTLRSEPSKIADETVRGLMHAWRDAADG